MKRLPTAPMVGGGSVRQVKFGLSYNTGFLGTDPDLMIAAARTAEDCGFESFYVPEHIALYPGAGLGPAVARDGRGGPSHQHERPVLDGEGALRGMLPPAGERGCLLRPEAADSHRQRRGEPPGQNVHHPRQVHLPPLAGEGEHVLVDHRAAPVTRVGAHAVQRDQRGVHLLVRVRPEVIADVAGDQVLDVGHELAQSA